MRSWPGVPWGRPRNQASAAISSGSRGMSQIIGIEIGGTKLQFVSADESGSIRERQKLQVEPGVGAAGIRRQIESELPELLRKGGTIATGVGFGGPVEWR